jgi:hypothetical protein
MAVSLFNSSSGGSLFSSGNILFSLFYLFPLGVFLFLILVTVMVIHFISMSRLPCLENECRRWGMAVAACKQPKDYSVRNTGQVWAEGPGFSSCGEFRIKLVLMPCQLVTIFPDSSFWVHHVALEDSGQGLNLEGVM